MKASLAPPTLSMCPCALFLDVQVRRLVADRGLRVGCGRVEVLAVETRGADQEEGRDLGKVDRRELADPGLVRLVVLYLRDSEIGSYSVVYVLADRFHARNAVDKSVPVDGGGSRLGAQEGLCLPDVEPVGLFEGASVRQAEIFKLKLCGPINKLNAESRRA